LYDWDSDKKKHKAIGYAMPFSPIYEFNGDVAAIKADLLADNKTGYSNEELETRFPPLYR
jgi:hypothetical protein